MKRKLSRTIAMMAAIALLATGCGGSGDGGSTSAEAESGGSTGAEETVSETTAEESKTVITVEAGERTVADGSKADSDTIVFAVNSEPLSLEPGAAASSDPYSKMAIIQVYETLLREAPADRASLQPLLAESWEFSEDGTELTFTLKDGVTFSNGDPMTADDVAFSINKVLAMPTTEAFRPIIESAEVVDEQHVKVNLHYAYKPVLNILSNQIFSIIDQEYYEQCEADGTNFGRSPMGTGAYVFKEWINGDCINFEANPNWHGGEVSIPKLSLKFMTDVTTAAINLESGEIDVFSGVDSADLPRLRENPDIYVLSVQSSGFYALSMNMDVEPLNDINVRKAIQLAINRQEIIDGGQDGIGWVTEAPITPGIFGYPEDFKGEPQNIEKAKELLAEAGYADGLDLVLKVQESSFYSRPCQVIQEQLRQIGINVELQTMEAGAVTQDLSNRDFELAYTWMSADYPDADSVVQKLFNSNQADAAAVTNLSRVRSEEVDTLLENAQRSLDDQERMDLYYQLSELNEENAWYIPILTSTNTLCTTTAVGGAFGTSGQYYYASDWTFQPE